MWFRNVVRRMSRLSNCEIFSQVLFLEGGNVMARKEREERVDHLLFYTLYVVL